MPVRSAAGRRLTGRALTKSVYQLVAQRQERPSGTFSRRRVLTLSRRGRRDALLHSSIHDRQPGGSGGNVNACLFPAEPSTKRHTLAGGMSNPKDVDLAPLLAELKLRRLNSKNTSHPINQPEIARALGVSSVQVSRLESGSRSLPNLTGSPGYTFL